MNPPFIKHPGRCLLCGISDQPKKPAPGAPIEMELLPVPVQCGMLLVLPARVLTSCMRGRPKVLLLWPHPPSASPPALPSFSERESTSRPGASSSGGGSLLDCNTRQTQGTPREMSSTQMPSWGGPTAPHNKGLNNSAKSACNTSKVKRSFLLLPQAMRSQGGSQARPGMAKPCTKAAASFHGTALSHLFEAQQLVSSVAHAGPSAGCILQVATAQSGNVRARVTSKGRHSLYVMPNLGFA